MARKRNYPVTVWLNDKELMLLKDKISKTLFYRSDYIRKCSLGKNITVVPGIRDLIIEFKKIGSNLDQLTRSVSCGTLTVLGDNLGSIKEDLKTVWTKLAVVMKKL
jgi:hypothetical protein